MRRGKNLSPNSDRDDTLWPFENKKKQKQIGPWTFANCCEMVICQDVVNDMCSPTKLTSIHIFKSYLRLVLFD